MKIKNSFILILFFTLCIAKVNSAQTTAVTKDKNVEWIRKVLRVNGLMIDDVTYDKASCTLKIDNQNPNHPTETSYDLVNLSDIDTVHFVWDSLNIYSRLSIRAKPGKKARTSYIFKSGENKYVIDEDPNPFIMKFYFTNTSFGIDDNIMERFTKTLKYMVKQCDAKTQ